MTVKELIEELKKFPEDAFVCCTGYSDTFQQVTEENVTGVKLINPTQVNIR